ncbi:MAG TPA: hypothetical protein VLB68_23435 [Pyrinomonadaceae bacterium]|nr:hypothetical protein [Pyrinomonadaceae bacterium]
MSTIPPSGNNFGSEQPHAFAENVVSNFTFGHLTIPAWTEEGPLSLEKSLLFVWVESNGKKQNSYSFLRRRLPPKDETKIVASPLPQIALNLWSM